MSVLSAPHFHNEEAAYAYVEARVWPHGPSCPRCGALERIGKLKGESTRVGVYKCYECRKPFTVKIGTIFEASHIPLRLWLQAMYLISSSKKGVSSHQLHRTLGVSLKSAWFLSHRIREAMRDGGLLPPMGGEGQHVEADETYIGKKDALRHDRKKRSGGADKLAVLSLVERGGKVRSFHIDSADKFTVGQIVADNINRESILQTDESRLYGDVGKLMADHQTVKHTAGEYVRGDAYTNTVESYFAVFKRGMKGVYQHCKEKHLHRYLAEFDFRYNERMALGVDDVGRTDALLRGVSGKRLTYRTVGGKAFT